MCIQTCCAVQTCSPCCVLCRLAQALLCCADLFRPAVLCRRVQACCAVQTCSGLLCCADLFRPAVLCRLVQACCAVQTSSPCCAVQTCSRATEVRSQLVWFWSFCCRWASCWLLGSSSGGTCTTPGCLSAGRPLSCLRILMSQWCAVFFFLFCCCCFFFSCLLLHTCTMSICPGGVCRLSCLAVPFVLVGAAFHFS